MKLSASPWSVVEALESGRRTLEDFFETCHAHGIDEIELLADFHWDGKTPEQMKACLDSRGMSVQCYSISGDFVVGEAEHRACIQMVKDAVDQAVFFGAGRIRLFPGVTKDNIPYEEGLALIKSGLSECAAYAAQKGIILCVENHGTYGGTSESLREILGLVSSPALLGNPDTGNFLLVDEDPVTAIQNLNGLVGHVHFKDFKRHTPPQYTSRGGVDYIGCPIGAGEVDLPTIVKLLAAQGYDGYLSIEQEENGEIDCFDALIQSIGYAKALLQTL